MRKNSAEANNDESTAIRGHLQELPLISSMIDDRGDTRRFSGYRRRYIPRRPVAAVEARAPRVASGGGKNPVEARRSAQTPANLVPECLVKRSEEHTSELQSLRH